MADIHNSELLDIKAGILKRDACVVIVRTEWNAAVVDELERGCLAALERLGIKEISVLRVPGAFELGHAVKSHWQAADRLPGRPDAYIVLACIIRGGTPHFEYVCQSVTQSVTLLNLELPLPTIFGVLTVDNQQQAEERIGGIHGHKGEEAAITAIKMIALRRQWEPK